ncbi:MAG: UxaA family hydrolase, partial [Atribacterota bacterium]|nr:UxaA family hydrolase [Atribacterota bacterium]
QTQRTIIGLGNNPNIGAVLIVSLEPVSAEIIKKDILRSGKKVETVTVQGEGGSINVIASGMRKAVSLVVDATLHQREPFKLDNLVIGVECGGSDTTSGISSNPVLGKISDMIIENGGIVILSETSEFLGAEHILAKRAANSTVSKKIINIVENVENETIRRGVNIREANPMPDNIKGGLTTIEEKSLGSIIKAGTKTIQGVLDYGEPPKGKGLFIMNTPAPGTDSLTGLAAGGVVLALFSTGVGIHIGHPVATTLKITGNPKTASTFIDNIDYTVCEVIQGSKTIEEISAGLFQKVLFVASGQKTKSEILKQEENTISRIEPTV